MVDIIVRKASLLEKYFPGIHDGATLVPRRRLQPAGPPGAHPAAAGPRRDELVAKDRGRGRAPRARVQGDPDGVVVSAVDVGAPADGVLEPDDVIVGANGKDIATPEDLSQVMAGVKPGETVTPEDRAGRRRADRTGRHEGFHDNPPRAIMGILIEPKLDLPVNITIDTGQIGGPSAGLAFALDIIDELGPTDIDHGEKVVATGEIALDGRVARDRRNRAENHRSAQGRAPTSSSSRTPTRKVRASTRTGFASSRFRTSTRRCTLWQQGSCRKWQRLQRSWRKLRQFGEEDPSNLA